MTEIKIFGLPHNIEHYNTEDYVSDDFKIEVLSRMLAGYSEITWNKLKSTRKLTYRRAGATLLYEWNYFQKQMEEWKCLKK